VTTADCKLIALNAGTGNPLWTKVTCDTELNYSISDSPYVGGGKVFVGNSGSETEIKNRGYVSAYDAATGKMLWRFYIVPSDDPDENDTPALRMAAKTWSPDQLAKFGGGGHSWNEMTYDPVSNQLFFGTSGAVPYVHALRSPEGGDNLFLSSIRQGQLGLQSDDEHHSRRSRDRRRGTRNAADRTEKRLSLRARPTHRRAAYRRQVLESELGDPHQHGNRPAGL